MMTTVCDVDGDGDDNFDGHDGGDTAGATRQLAAPSCSCLWQRWR